MGGSADLSHQGGARHRCSPSVRLSALATIIGLLTCATSFMETTTWSDGANADKVGTDYRRRVADAQAPGTIRLDLAPGGGAVVRLRRK